MVGSRLGRSLRYDRPMKKATKRARVAWLVGLALSLTASGCGARSELRSCEVEGMSLPCSSFCGVGVETCVHGTWQPCTAPAVRDDIPIAITVRDFRQAHPDFEDGIGDDLGIVEPVLAGDGKPSYAGAPTTPTTTGKAHFDEWFHDAPGVNMTEAREIVLSRVEQDPPLYTFSDQSFFPIDGAGFGDEGNGHNFHFTAELSVEFRYKGGERFTFTGDDDLWVFINRRLAINMGGVHPSESRTVDLDESAGALGLAVDDVFTLSLFFAERHTNESHFRIDTSIAEFNVCPAQ